MTTAAQLASRAEAKVGTTFQTGMCLLFVRLLVGAPAGTPDAATAWRNAKHKHVGDRHPPAGAIVYWTGGSHGHGHIAVSVGGGYIVSTDTPTSGHVSKVPLSWIEQHWTLERYEGWAEDCNGVTVTGFPKGVEVRLANLRPGLTNSDVRELQQALVAHGCPIPAGATGYFGDQTRAACRAFQVRQGWTGSNADGIPGAETCSRLGLTVVG